LWRRRERRWGTNWHFAGILNSHNKESKAVGGNSIFINYKTRLKSQVQTAAI
jgi:hypothetical protein